jgi:translocation and assembly module TamB
LTDAQKPPGGPPPEDIPEVVAEAATKVARKIGWPGLVIIIAVSLVVLVAVLLGGVRFGAITPQGRAFLEARTSGLKLGRIGRLKIEGLTGDIWSAFGVRRLTISDEKGVWLDAADLYVDWRPAELFYRRFHADEITARQVVVLRRPTLTPKGKSSAAPLSVDLDPRRPAPDHPAGIQPPGRRLRPERRL